MATHTHDIRTIGSRERYKPTKNSGFLYLLPMWTMFGKEAANCFMIP